MMTHLNINSSSGRRQSNAVTLLGAIPRSATQIVNLATLLYVETLFCPDDEPLPPCIFSFSTTFELDKIYSARHYKRRFFNHAQGLPGQLGLLAITFSLFPSAITTLPTCQQDEDPVYHSHAALCHRACNCQHGIG
jgi:hypothetical protein